MELMNPGYYMLIWTIIYELLVTKSVLSHEKTIMVVNSIILQLIEAKCRMNTCTKEYVTCNIEYPTM